jgi:hypothetical protein
MLTPFVKTIVIINDVWNVGNSNIEIGRKPQNLGFGVIHISTSNQCVSLLFLIQKLEKIFV